ncbi:ribonuclease D [Rheinheimera sp.]|uniref:ribonuclease D n=1 Tax=Rheinheimera sp. TaxID=1869214 RepID=UPI0027B9A780|nr:ribonuclease D [Rheinheimera sp.]
MSYRMITENQQLAEFCAKALLSDCLAVDTEFVRTNTLLPKLGLIQLYAGQEVVLVDPLCITDWQPLDALLRAPAVLKMLHSCNEDLEAFASIGLLEIRPLLDTQLAAELAGMGASLGYGKMVEQLTGRVLDKSESRTDWLARPLATTQLDYAANDVLYLWPLKDLLVNKLPRPELFDLLLAEGEQMIARRLFQLPLQFKYLELKNSWQCQPRELAVLKTLCSWRQSYAEQKDIALGLVLKDALLYELARRRPATLESLAQLPDLHPRELRRYGQQILTLLNESKNLTPQQCPQTFYHLATFPGFKQLTQDLTEAIQQAAKAADIPAGFLSVRRQLNEYLNWCWRVTDEERSLLPVPEFLRGWRRSLLLPYLPQPAHVQALIQAQ